MKCLSLLMFGLLMNGLVFGANVFECDVMSGNKVIGGLTAIAQESQEKTDMSIIDMDFFIEFEVDTGGEKLVYQKTFLAPFYYFPEDGIGLVEPGDFDGGFEASGVRLGGLWVNFAPSASVSNQGHLVYTSTMAFADGRLERVQRKVQLACGINAGALADESKGPFQFINPS